MGLGHVLYVCVLYDCLFIQFVCLSNLSVNLFICLSFKPLCLFFSVSTCLSIVCVWVYERMRVCVPGRAWSRPLCRLREPRSWEILLLKANSLSLIAFTIIPSCLFSLAGRLINPRIWGSIPPGGGVSGENHKILLDTGVLQFLTCDKPQEVWESVHRLVCDEKEWLEWRTILQNIHQYINIHQR